MINVLSSETLNIKKMSQKLTHLYELLQHAILYKTSTASNIEEINLTIIIYLKSETSRLNR